MDRSSSPSSPPEPHGQDEKKAASLLPLALGALGVVYGDIGTSPLYALRECFHGPHAIAPTAAALSTVLQTAVRQTARDPLGMAKALASAAAAGAGMALDRAGSVVEPRMTRVLNALQIPTAADLKGLARRVEELLVRAGVVQQLERLRRGSRAQEPGRAREGQAARAEGEGELAGTGSHRGSRRPQTRRAAGSSRPAMPKAVASSIASSTWRPTSPASPRNETGMP